VLPFPRPRTLFCLDDNYRCQPRPRRAGLALQRPAALRPFLTGEEIEDVLITAADPDALRPDGAEVLLPRGCDRLDVGVSLGVVTREHPDAIGGYVVALDFARLDVPPTQAYLARSFPTHKVVSRDVVPDIAWPAAMQMRIDGEVRQQSSTQNMIADVQAIIGTISRRYPLAGDLIFTGSPAGRPADTEGPFLEAGSVIEATIDGVGSVSATVVSE
jgi:2-keto-4-pentenoate hydratase/2-oxohepta-3-ene-1,7-dioic acid hydratase in catechol pathway